MSADPVRARLQRDLERRRGFRVEIDLEVAMRSEDGARAFTCKLINVGGDGGCLELPVEVDVGDVLILTWPEELGPGIKPLELACDVAWTVTELSDAPWPTGVLFRALDERTKKRLHEAILREATR